MTEKTSPFIVTKPDGPSRKGRLVFLTKAAAKTWGDAVRPANKTEAQFVRRGAILRDPPAPKSQPKPETKPSSDAAPSEPKESLS